MYIILTMVTNFDFFICIAFMLITAIIAIMLIDSNKQSIINKLQNKLDLIIAETENNTSTVALDGLFEIHITIDPKQNYVPLMTYIKSQQQFRVMKIVYSVSSVKNNQYMLSYFTRKTDHNIAIEHANETAEELTNMGIDVVRIKVEGHNAKGTPSTTQSLLNYIKFTHSKYDNSDQPYFEFHIKVNDSDSQFSYDKLEKFCQQFNTKDKSHSVAISYNLCSSNRKPLLTIRVYNKGFIEAQEFKDTVIETFKQHNYIFEQAIEQEFCIYDTNHKLDDGWL